MTQEFTKEELKALDSLITFASETISIDDEPLLYILLQKVDRYICEYNEEQ